MNKKQQEQYFILNVVMVGILIILFAMLVDCGINAYANETEETTAHEQWASAHMVSAWCYLRPSKENPHSGELTWRCYKFITPSWIREDIGAAIPYTVMV